MQHACLAAWELQGRGRLTQLCPVLLV
eukprot:COSAG06_NODE_45725_length_352_cov_1.158103_1_plen_26_part_10